MNQTARDHGGGIDAAIREFGGTRADWLDLSTGINPVPYPLPEFEASDWTDLPDAQAMGSLLQAARNFWNVPDTLDILAAPGASSLIARIPCLMKPGNVDIQTRTYNEHAAAFRHSGWQVSKQKASAKVVVHPNNPDGEFWDSADEQPGNHELLVIDESFCDIASEKSYVPTRFPDNAIVLKSFGKFWGLAGLRLGFAIGQADIINKLRNMLGPWAVTGPALRIGATALADANWATNTRERLSRDADRLDQITTSVRGVKQAGGTSLFRLYETPNATEFQNHLARHHILSRIFPYSTTWLRLGLPAGDANWQRLENALNSLP